MTNKSLFLLVLAVGCGDDTKAPAIDAPKQPPDIDAAMPDAHVPTADDFTDAEKAILVTLTPVPAAPPADTTNAFADSAAAATLGQMLFFDKSYSGALTVGDDTTNHGLGAVGETGKVACASCHGVGSATLDDQRSAPNNVSLGTAYGTRNAHGLVNSSFYAWGNWGGRFDSQWSLPLAVAENATIMKSTRLAVVHMIEAKYHAAYNAAFPTMPLDSTALADTVRFPATGKPGDAAYDGMADADKATATRIFANFGKALAAYTRTLVSRDAPFDRYVAGDHAAITESAKRGLHTFLAKCTACHTGPLMTDSQFHAIGVAQTGPNVPAADLGRYQDIPPLLTSVFNSNGTYSDDVTTGRLTNVAQTNGQQGAFRTKGLRGVAAGAPYMHDGALASLADVVAFYNTGGGDVPTGGTKDSHMVPLNLDAAAQADLVAFLETLTGDSVDAMRLADTSQ